MPYVTVPRDLSKVKNKLAMGLTLRQLLAVAAAGAVCVPIYLLTMKALGDMAIYIAIIPAIPAFFVGFFRATDGRPFEKVMVNYIKVRYQQPQVRPYQTQNIYASLEIMQQIQEVVKQYEDEEDGADAENVYSRNDREANQTA